MANRAERRLVVEVPIAVRTYDVDFVGHVNNIVYIRWLEDLRIAFLAAHYPLDEMVKERFSPVITTTRIDYKQAVFLFERPVGRIWLQELGRAVFVLGQEFEVDGEIRSSATQRGCFMNLDTGKIMRVPPRMREKYDADVPSL